MNKGCRWILATAAAGTLLAAGPLQAEIYKYQDWDGNLLFSDQPMKGPYRLIGKVGEEYESPNGGGGTGSPTTVFDNEAYRERIELYTPMINATARLVRLRPELLHAVIRAESAYNPNAISRAGAVGLMQLMPQTAARYGVSDRYDPVANLRAGAHYLRDLLELFNDDLRLAVAAYNAGENAVIRNGHSIPPYPETREYVRRVMLYYRENLQPKYAAND